MFSKSRFFNFVNRSLRAKVTFGVVVPLGLILGIFTVIEYVRLQELMLDQLSSISSLSSQLIESNLRHEMVGSKNDGIQVTLDTIQESEEIQIIYVLDIDGRVVFSPNNVSVGKQLDHSQPNCQPCHSLQIDQRPSSVIVTSDNDQRVFRSMVPIKNSPECGQCHDPGQQLLGLLLMDISIAPFEKGVLSDLRENFLWWIGAILITVFVVNFAIRRLVLHRLERVTEAITNFGETESPQLIVDVQPDEIGKLVSTFKTMSEKVEKRSQENRYLSDNLRHQSKRKADLLNRLITAQEDERKNLARELHDGLGQSLAGLALRAETMDRLIASDQSKAFTQLDQIKSLIEESSDNMYDLILDLRPSSLDDLGLVPTFRSHSERVLNNTGIELEFSAHNFSDRLPPEIEITIFRIFQEALTNIFRHANANKIDISFAIRNGFFEGEITDDGQGFDLRDNEINENNPRGLGLLGIQERVTQCDGQLEILSSPGQGTKIQIRIPLMEETFE